MKLHKKFNHDLPGACFWGERGDIPIRVNIAKFKPNQIVKDPLHYHKTRTTYFAVVSGSITFEVNGNEILVTPQVMLEIMPKEVYRILRVGELGCTYIVVGSHNDIDKVVIKN